MLELSNSVADNRETGGDVAQFLRSEQHRSIQGWQRQQDSGNFSVKKVLKALQSKFSHTHDLDYEIQRLVDTQVQQRTRELFRKANYDGLTHLPNRNYFHETLETLVINAKQVDTSFTLLFLDLDGFKAVNDNLGHQIGDELLSNVAARLISAVREGDIVSRLGGDEFVILLADMDDKEVTDRVCQRIVDELSRPFLLSGEDVAISTSLGVARFPTDGKTSAQLIDNADKALYAAKHQGRNRYRYFEDIEMLTQQTIAQQLNNAIDNNQIELRFEPQIDLNSGKLLGASVTAYWPQKNSDKSFLVHWQNQLSDSKQAHSLALWLLDSGLYYLHQWHQRNDSAMVSIPLLKALWQSDSLLELLEQRLEHYGLTRSQMQFEFSLAELQESSDLHQKLLQLSQAGFQLTLTEAGKAPLDFNLMAGLNIQELKLDAAWLQKVLQQPENLKWLTALVQMAQSLDICVMANGISEAQQLQKVKQSGCVIAQGDYWSEPLCANAMQQLIVD